jgi:hypothetical protein
MYYHFVNIKHNYISFNLQSRVSINRKQEKEYKAAAKVADDQISAEVQAKPQEKEVESVPSFVDENSDEDEESVLSHGSNPKQQLAITIRNWSTIPENDSSILNEGAVQALIGLSGIDDQIVKLSCAGAFYHLSSRQRNRSALLSLNSVAGITSIAFSSRSW